MPPDLSIYTNTGQTQNLYGVYAQDQIKFDRFILTLGGRQDWVDTTTRDRSLAHYTDDAALIHESLGALRQALHWLDGQGQNIPLVRRHVAHAEATFGSWISIL